MSSCHFTDMETDTERLSNFPKSPSYRGQSQDWKPEPISFGSCFTNLTPGVYFGYLVSQSRRMTPC